jgi:hypothetical protein
VQTGVASDRVLLPKRVLLHKVEQIVQILVAFVIKGFVVRGVVIQGFVVQVFVKSILKIDTELIIQECRVNDGDLKELRDLEQDLVKITKHFMVVIF